MWVEEKSGILAISWNWKVPSQLSLCSSQGQLMWLPEPFGSVKYAWISYILCKCSSQHDESSFKEIPYWIGFSTSHARILERLMDPSLKRSRFFRCHAWGHTMNWSLRKFSHAERTGEQLAESSNDSDNAGGAASTHRQVYGCSTSTIFQT